jgi:small subunit ribosomal protein S18
MPESTRDQESAPQRRSEGHSDRSRGEGRYEDRGGREGGGRYEGGREERGGRRPRRFHRGKVCQFCVEKAIYIDYKDLEHLRGYVTDSGKILPRRITGNCAHHQRMTTTALKRARMVALLPYKV